MEETRRGEGEGSNSTYKSFLDVLPSALSPKSTFSLPTPLCSLGEVAHVVQSNRALTLWLLVGFAQSGASPGDWREGGK